MATQNSGILPGKFYGQRRLAGDLDLIPGLGGSPGEGMGYPLQYSGLENSMDRGTWWATVHGVAKSRTRLSDFHFTSLHPVNNSQRGIYTTAHHTHA